MNDTELTDLTGPEADRLRALLHRAADSVDVTNPDHVELQPAPARRRSGPWLAAAAAVLLVAAIGATFWLTGDDGGRRIDTGPADPSVTVAPRVLEESGLWRLPEDLDGYRVVGAQDGGSFDTSSVDTAGVLAVDEPDAPARWLLVQAYDEIGEAPEGSRVVELSDEVTATLIPTGGSTWFQLSRLDGTGRIVAGGSAFGIDDEELVDLLTEHLGSSDALVSADAPTAPMEAMLDDAGFGDDRLVWQGDGDGGPGSSNRTLQITLAGDDDTEVVILLDGINAPAWAQEVRFRMTAELILQRSRGTSAGELVVRPRPDLGRHVLEVIEQLPDGESNSYLVLHSDDGTRISAVTSRSTAPVAGSAPARLDEEQQLRVLNSLRAMSESEFRARLEELGARFVEPGSMGTTTTVVGTPGG